MLLVFALLVVPAVGYPPARPDARQPRPLIVPPPAPGARFGRFPDSRVTGVTAWQVTEEADFLPDNILPAYIGSERIGAGLDASGMQNLDCVVGQAKRWTGVNFEHKDDLYVFHERMIADHITPRNMMPLGRLEYDLTVDGQALTGEDLGQSVARWRRVVDVRRATATTTLDLKVGVRLSVLAFCLQEGSQAVFRFTARSVDGRAHHIVLSPQVRLTLRARNNGGAIADRITRRRQVEGAAFIEGSARRDGPRRAWEDYRLRWGAAGGAGGREWAIEDALGVTFDVALDGRREVAREAAFWFGSSAVDTDGDGASAAWLRTWRRQGAEGLLQAHARDWARWYDSGADVVLGDPLREFLFHNSLYLLRAGSTYRNGAPLEFLLFHPENWYGATFWDLTFVLDGLNRCSHLEPSRRALAWLRRVMNTSGRPFHWLARYDGSSAMPPGGRDTGYMVNAAHAMAAIRFFETTGDRAFLRSTGYPIVRTVAEYAVRERFVKEGDGYIGAGAGLDVNQPLELNETYSAAWFGVVLRKAGEYAALLGADRAARTRWRVVADGLRLERGADGYHQSRSVSRPFGWVSLLLYPTEAMPLLDLDTFRRNRAVQSFLYDYHVYQPWVYFWQAISDLRLGEEEADRAEAHITEGMKAVHGPGYFAEIVPKDMEGLPPYQTAHAAYLTATAEQFVSGSIWDDTVRVFVHLPSRLRGRAVRFSRLRTARGVTASGAWSPRAVQVRLEGTRPVSLRLRVPDVPPGARLRVTVDDHPVLATRAGSVVSLPVRLRAGRPVTLRAAWEKVVTGKGRRGGRAGEKGGRR